MLHKSFKPAKCKTALKLVVSRTKLLKNKKDVLVKQLRRDLAQLLQAGQEQTARVRVEHVIREEKMMAAYELIEIFCELIAIRLPIVESQKNCPIDLKEAVSSVIFATPRCSDIPELIDVRKQFTAKYGKEFVSAAIELRPDCGVNRTLVEKLSAKSPDGPTKLKILTAIAEEHNIKWDPTSFGEKDSNPQEDLLNGPKMLETASKMHVESSNVHISPENEAKQEAPINHQGNGDRLSFGSQTISPIHANVLVAPAPNLKPPGNGIDGMEPSNSYSEDQNPNFVNRQNWNMQFKDATSAAQAAAESAERASMAARAAAELSTHVKIMNQNSTGFQSSSAYGSRDEEPTRHSGSSPDSEAFARRQMSNSLEDRNFRQQDEEISAKGRHNFMGHAERLSGDSNMSDDRPSEIRGATSTSDSSKDKSPLTRPHEHWMNDESSQSFGGWNYQNQTSVNKDEEEDVHLATLTERLHGGSHQSEAGFILSNSKKTSRGALSDRASFDTHINSFQNLPHSKDDVTIGEFSMRGQPQKLEVEPSDEMLDVLRTEKVSNLEDETFRLHSIGAPSYSHSSFSSSVNDGRANVVTNSWNPEDAVIGNPFANVDEERYHEDAKTTKGGRSVVFDDYGSDVEESVFDLDKGPEASSDIFSPERKSMSYLSENINPASSRRNMVDLFGNNISESHSSREQSSTSIFSESLDEPASQVLIDELAPVIFDDAREAYSENKVEPENIERDSEDIFTSGSERSRFNLSGKGSDKFDDPVNKKNQDQGSHSRVSSVHESDDDDSKAPQRSSTVDDSETSGKSSSDGPTELSFGKLTGGLRNKGYRHPPYVKSLLGEGPSSVQAAEGEIKRPPISNPPETWSSSEIVDDPYSQVVNDEIQKQTSTVGTYGRRSLDEASSVRKLSEDTATSPGNRKETIDSEIGNPNTCNKDVEYNRLTGRVEEKSMRSLSGEAPSSKQAVGDPLIEYGFSSSSGQISDNHLELTREMDSSEGKSSNSRDFLSPYDLERGRDAKEEVPSEVSGSRGRYGAGLSRRTRGSPSKADRSSLLKSSVASEEETGEPLKSSSRSPYKDRRSEVKSASLSKEVEAQERRAEINSSSRNSHGTGAYRSTPSESVALDDKGSSDRLQLGKRSVEKPKSEPQKSSERRPKPSQMSDKPSKKSLDDTSRESSFDRASHVHPKLPDYDSVAAQLELLRANRK